MQTAADGKTESVWRLIVVIDERRNFRLKLLQNIFGRIGRIIIDYDDFMFDIFMKKFFVQLADGFANAAFLIMCGDDDA